MRVSLSCKKIFLILIFSIFSLLTFASTRTVKVGWYIQDKYQNVSDSGVPYGYIYDFLQKISNEIDEIVEEYRSMSIEERKKNQAMVMKNEQLHYKCYSIIDYLNYKKGNITFNLPDGIDRPDFIKSKESGLRKVLSFFKK